MPWLKLDDEYPGHRKIRRRSDGAFRLHTTALCACAHDLTDGKVTREDIEDMPGIKPKQADRFIIELVTAGLWEQRAEGEWWIHDYLNYNPSKADLEATREAARVRQAKWKASRSEQGGNAVSNASPNTSPTLPRPVPVPVPVPYPSLSTRVDSKSKSLRSVPRDPETFGIA